MTDFRSRFQVPDDAQIRERLQKDLKDKDLSSLNWEFEEYVLPPLVTPAEAPAGKLTRTGSGWLTGVDLSESAANTPDALRAVKEMGAEAIIVKASESTQQDFSGFKKIFVVSEPGQETEKFNNHYCADDNLVPGGNQKFTTAPFQVNARSFREAGAALTDQYAIALAKGHEYLFAHLESGIDPEELAEKFWFSFSTGLSYLPEIAGLRAFRLLWKEISGAYLKHDTEAFISVHTSERLLSHQDTYTNLLRTTTQAMGAVSGGADVLFVLPHDYAIKNWNPFSARLAINIQHLLREESYFDRVADPAAGSYYLENLTQTFAEKIWEAFQDIEKNGGFSTQFANGTISKRISDNVQRQSEQLNSGKRTMIGVNKYPGVKDSVQARKEVLSATFSPSKEKAK